MVIPFGQGYKDPLETLFLALFRIIFGHFVEIDLRHCTSLRLGPTVAAKHLYLRPYRSKYESSLGPSIKLVTRCIA